MARGRPTNDPKGTLVAVRLSDRQIRVLEERARREGVGLSEAIRRIVDESAAAAPSPSRPRVRPPTPEERKTFDQLRAVMSPTPRR